MIIPLDSLSPDILHNIIKEYVLQEGTEYGFEEISMKEKIAQVHKQLIVGTAVVVYSELYETVNILPADQFNQG